jgi:hypothetical protein
MVSACTNYDQDASSSPLEPSVAGAPGGNGSSGATGNPFEHCRNATGGAPSGACEYTNGAVNQQTGHYFEGDGVPVKMVLNGLTPGQSYSVTIGFDHKDSKGTVNAYDFPADYDLTEPHAVSSPCISGEAPGGCPLAAGGDEQVPFALSAGDPSELAFNSVAGIGRANLTIWGGDITDGQILVTRDDDEKSSFVVNFTVGSSGNVALAFSGHLASEIYYGEGLGAASISGAPIHHRWIDDNGSSPGNKELPLQQGAIHKPILVFGTKYLDNDGDGDITGESGLGGWHMMAFNGSPVQGAVTISEGDWIPEGFDLGVGDFLMALRPGDYTICEVLADPDGHTDWTQTYPNTEAADCTGLGSELGGLGHALSLVEDQDPVEDIDFGNFEWGEITVCKAELVTDDTYVKGAGWTMNAVPGAFPAESSSGATDAEGCVTLDVKAGGDLMISEVMKAGWAQEYPNVDGDNSNSPFTVPAAGITSNVVLGGAYDDTGAPYTFKNFEAATVEGHKYHDLNGDGDWDAEEPGLSGWEICAHPDGGGDPICTTTAEADEGAGITLGYYILSLKPGTYDIRETCQDDWYQSDPGIDCLVGYEDQALLGGVANATTGMDFGNYQYATFKGMKFHDLDADGVNDDEDGLDDWTITVDGLTGMLVQVDEETTTAGGGLYEFSLPPGTYTFGESCDGQDNDYGDWYQSAPGQAGDACDATFDVSLISQQVSEDNDFGNYQYATFSGAKWHDLNGDGVWDDGEPGLESWDITLAGTSGPGDAVDMTDATDSDGVYTFSVAPGTYSITEACEASNAYGDWYQSWPGDTGTDCDAGYDVTLVSQEVNEDNDFGNYQYALFNGMKFEDMNGNGVFNDEPGIDDWEIHFFGTTGLGHEVDETLTTENGGLFSIMVAPGSYTVCEIQQDDWVQSYPGEGVDCGALDASYGPEGYGPTLISQQQDEDNKFGNWEYSEVSGMKWEDLDGNGAMDGGEVGIADWTIHLFGTTGMGDSFSELLTTNGSGEFSYDLLPPGNYTLCEVIDDPDKWEQTFPTSGVDCSAYDIDHGVTHGPYGYDLTGTESGSDIEDQDFGNRMNTGLKSGQKWWDDDRDGIMDGDDYWLNGYPIYLFGTTDEGQSVEMMTVTAYNADLGLEGYYEFAGLQPGTYTVCEGAGAEGDDLPQAWFQTYPMADTDPGDNESIVDCGAIDDAFKGLGYGFEIAGGDELTGNDFANYIGYGCTPGYWRQEQHFGNWAAPYSPVPTVDDTDIETVGGMFSSAPAGFASDGLVEGLMYQGGNGVNGATEILLRAAIAGVLNMANSEVNGFYKVAIDEDDDGDVDLTIDDGQGLIDAVNAALDSGDRDTMLILAGFIDEANNHYCPLARAPLGS